MRVQTRDSPDSLSFLSTQLPGEHRRQLLVVQFFSTCAQDPRLPTFWELGTGTWPDPANPVFLS